MLACRLPEDYSESAGVMVENPALEAFTAEEHIMQYPIQQQEAWHPTICSTAAKSSIKKEKKKKKKLPQTEITAPPPNYTSMPICNNTAILTKLLDFFFRLHKI